MGIPGIERTWMADVLPGGPVPASFSALLAFGAGGGLVETETDAPIIGQGSWRRTSDNTITFTPVQFEFTNGVWDGTYVASGTLTYAPGEAHAERAVRRLVLRHGQQPGLPRRRRELTDSEPHSGTMNGQVRGFSRFSGFQGSDFFGISSLTPPLWYRALWKTMVPAMPAASADAPSSCDVRLPRLPAVGNQLW